MKKFLTTLALLATIGTASAGYIDNPITRGYLWVTGAHRDSTNSTGTANQILRSTGTSTQWVATSSLGFPSGTVTAVSVATANGVSGSSSGGATPALTITLGAITPSTVNGLIVNSPGNAANTAVGVSAMNGSNSGTGQNSAFGYNALYTNTTGSSNTGVGFVSLYANSTGAGNVALGAYAGRYETGSDGFYVDNQDRTNTAGDKSKALFYGKFNATAASQELNINASTSLFSLFNKGFYRDSTNATGTSGQVLQSTGTSTLWATLASAGTVTSVSLSAPTGLTAASTTCTTACRLALTLTSGYVIPLTASTTQWATAYASTTALTPAYIKSQITGTYPIIVTGGVVSSGFSTSTTNNFTSVNSFSSQTNLSNASSSNISTTNFYATGTVALATTTINGNLTTTGARINRVVGYSSASTITINVDTTDEATTTVNQTTTFANPTGTAIDGFGYMITALATTTQTISWGTLFSSSTDLVAPLTVASGTTEFLWKYNKFTNKYLFVGKLGVFN